MTYKGLKTVSPGHRESTSGVKNLRGAPDFSGAIILFCKKKKYQIYKFSFK